MPSHRKATPRLNSSSKPTRFTCEHVGLPTATPISSPLETILTSWPAWIAEAFRGQVPDAQDPVNLFVGLEQ